MKELDQSVQIHMQQPPNLSTLAAHATTTAPDQPLSEHDAVVLTNRFPSMHARVEATRTASRENGIAPLLGPAIAINVIDFWEDEWIA